MAIFQGGGGGGGGGGGEGPDWVRVQIGWPHFMGGHISEVARSSIA